MPEHPLAVAACVGLELALLPFVLVGILPLPDLSEEERRQREEERRQEEQQEEERRQEEQRQRRQRQREEERREIEQMEQDLDKIDQDILERRRLVQTYRERLWKLKAKPECRIKDDDQQCSNNTDVTEFREFAENEPVLVIQNTTGPSHCLSKKDAEAILNTEVRPCKNPYTRKPLHPASLRDFVKTLNKEGGNYCNPTDGGQGGAMRREGQRQKRLQAAQQAQAY